MDLIARGPRLPVTVTADEPSIGIDGSPPPRRTVDALIDTGSGRTIIQAALAAELHLRPVGRVEIDTASSVDVTAEEYAIALEVGGHRPIRVRALAAALPVPDVRLLIGRDALAHGRFVYDGRRSEFAFELD